MVSLDPAALTPAIGASYEHPNGKFKVLRAVWTEWHIKWENGPHAQIRFREWKRLVRSGLTKL